MNYEIVEYHGARLEMPEFLAELFPTHLPPERWPTFCGPGKVGDWLVPDYFCGIPEAIACFIHDIDYAVSPQTFSGFVAANIRFYQNSMALIVAANVSPMRKYIACIRCHAYFVGVSTFGVFAFRDKNVVPFPPDDPFQHPVVRSRLKRLAYADIGLADVVAQNGGYDAVN